MNLDQKIVVQFYEKFGTKAKGRLVDIVDGPIVCSFVFEPESMTSVSKLLKAIKEEKDVILSPDGNRMIIQIPKEDKKIQLFSDLIKTQEYEHAKGVIPMMLGVDTTGKVVMKDLAKIPHLLITGRTGGGKTTCTMSMLKSITKKMAPSECKTVIFDPVSVDYGSWKKDPHLLYPVINDLNDGFRKFDMISKMIDYRYQVFVENNVNNIAEYHEKTHRVDMPYVVILIDELSYYMHKHKRITEKFIGTVCSKGRAAGIHLITATQYPMKDVLTLAIKAFFPTQVCFNSYSTKDSIQMFGEPGAEKLQPMADMFYSDAGRVPTRIHGALITVEEIEKMD